MTKRGFLAVLLLIFTLLTACDPTPALPGSPEPTPTPSPSPTLPPIPTARPAPDPVEDLLARMSTEERVGQLLVAGLEGTRPGEDGAKLLREYQVGGIILFGRNIESAGQLMGLLNGLKGLNAGRVPLFLCVDQEGGRVDRMPPEVDRTPKALTVGETDSTETARRYGALLAEECAAFGFNMDFAPCLDIWSNPENTVIGDRAFGTDWRRVRDMGWAAVEAMLKGGAVVPVVKHFPGHGDTLADSHTDLPVVDKTLEELWRSELEPYRLALSGGQPWEKLNPSLPAVMVGHILLTQADPERPASLSPAVVTDLLRKEFVFDGVVVTDDLTMGAISNTYGMGEAAVLAVEAGCDLLLVCHGLDNLEEARSALLAAVESGRISEERLNESVRRLLTLKQDFGVSDTPCEPPDVDALNAAIAALNAAIAAPAEDPA